jgi:putative addiction module component (TIGR02574 family)
MQYDEAVDLHDPRAENAMSEAATTLLEQLLKLSEADHVMIADRLWESLSDEKQQELINETTNDPEFQAELERRLKEVEEHPERLLDGETVMAELREHLKRKHAQ